MYIPQYAEVVVNDMQIGDSFTVADLDIAKDDNITILLEDDEVVCSLQEPQEEVIADDEESEDASEVPTVDETEEKSDEE